MFLELLKTYLSVIVVPLVFLIGIILSHCFQWIQLTHCKQALNIILSNKQAQSDRGISAFSALSAVLGGNLGTGNIAGTAVALSMGGPGALFWMCIMAIIGSIIKFTGCYIAIMNRVKYKSNEWLGGPMYYINQVLKSPITAQIFSILVIVSAFTVGNFVQINSISLPLINHGIKGWQASLLIMPLISFVILDKQKRFAEVCTHIVPWMAIFYIGLCLSVIIINSSKLPFLLSLIVKSAFTSQSLIGGSIGYGLFESIRIGFDRGLFATDAGIGIAGILHSEIPDKTNQKQTALEQGLVSILAPIVVMIICMMTGLVLLATDAWLQPGLASTQMCVYAFVTGTGWQFSEYILLITLILFASTTLLTWSYCAERALIYLNMSDYLYHFKILFICFIPIGCLLQAKWVWLLADISINLMLIINLSAVFIIARQYFTPLRWKFD